MHASLVGQLGRTEEAHSIALELEKKRQSGWIAGAALVGAWSGAGMADAHWTGWNPLSGRAMPA